MKCAGSIFKNFLLVNLTACRGFASAAGDNPGRKVAPPTFSSRSALRACIRGDIHVADYHANLIYNAGLGSARDLRGLIGEAKSRCARRLWNRSRGGSPIRGRFLRTKYHPTESRGIRDKLLCSAQFCWSKTTTPAATLEHLAIESKQVFFVQSLDRIPRAHELAKIFNTHDADLAFLDLSDWESASMAPWRFESSRRVLRSSDSARVGKSTTRPSSSRPALSSWCLRHVEEVY
jgi:hypothetical protein